VAAGSLGLGGRGQFRDWEIFNRPHKGYSPAYAFPAIWIQSGNSKPIARVLEGAIMPPYEGEQGLSFANVPGLPRLETATFTGQYPRPYNFHDRALSVTIALDAFSPFHSAQHRRFWIACGYPALPSDQPWAATVRVAIAFSIDNLSPRAPGKELMNITRKIR